MTSIRVAEPKDAIELLALAADFATSFVVEPETFRFVLAELLASPNAYLGVAEVKGEVVGYVLGFEHLTFYANGRVAWVEEIAVRSDCRRSGIGTLLMHSLECWASRRGSKLVALATRRAAEFYKALGYSESAVYFRKLLA